MYVSMLSCSGAMHVVYVPCTFRISPASRVQGDQEEKGAAGAIDGPKPVGSRSEEIIVSISERNVLKCLERCARLYCCFLPMLCSVELRVVDESERTNIKK